MAGGGAQLLFGSRSDHGKMCVILVYFFLRSKMELSFISHAMLCVKLSRKPTVCEMKLTNAVLTMICALILVYFL